MPNSELTLFLNRMHYLSGTGQLGGLATLAFGAVKFQLSPAIDDNTAYALFGYLSERNGQLSAEDKILGWLCLNAAAYMADNHIGYRARFCWDTGRGILWNLRMAFSSRHVRRLSQEMQHDTNAMWIPACDVALQNMNTTGKISSG